MPERTAQQRIRRLGALLAVMMGAGSGCSNVIGADFDKPSQSGGATGGGTTAASSAETSGAMSSAETSGASSASSGGMDGADGGCTGNCGITKIYVGLDVDEIDDCGSNAKDGIMSNDMKDISGNFKLVSAFNVFTTQQPDTTPVNKCTTSAGKGWATTDNIYPCISGNSGVTTLGYAPRSSATGYEQLRYMSNLEFSALVLENSTYKDVCCHGTCVLAGGFALP